jgi:hypothetical protein
MKILKNSFLFALILSLGLYIPTFALEAGVSVSGDSSIGIARGSDNTEVSSETSTTVNVKTEGGSEQSEGNVSDRNNVSSNEDNKGNSDNRNTVSATSTTTEESHSEADEHRSVVATFVQGLLKVADQDRGIGAQVRVIAQEQNDSGTTTADSIAKVEARGNLETFLIGSDFKNLGVIRSELASTSARIATLTAIASSTTDVTAKAELNAQIKLLQDDQVNVNAFVDAHENTFSLFGWFVKLFNR